MRWYPEVYINTHHQHHIEIFCSTCPRNIHVLAIQPVPPSMTGTDQGRVSGAVLAQQQHGRRLSRCSTCRAPSPAVSGGVDGSSTSAFYVHLRPTECRYGSTASHPPQLGLMRKGAMS